MILRARTAGLRSLPVNSLAPNMLTVLALCAGLTSMRFSLNESWQLAVMAILVAALFDGLDGRLARLLKGTSKFGAELDSLSDFVCFGVAPSILLYRWTLNDLGGVGWILVLAFSVCCALRLARFNTALDSANQPTWMTNFFMGVPAPAAGGLVLLPVMLSFQVAESFFHYPLVNAFVVAAVAFLMVSKVPTYSFKRLRVRREYILPVLIVVGLLAAVLWSYPWQMLTGIGLLYLASIPLSMRSYRRRAASASEGVSVEELSNALPEEEEVGD
ncbi:MAG: CDP-diacylglycerol--serine O-phosphatidyltransferase [Alphaproteobacteria bacterium]|nr:CDP-diacylglycerol--serine O-phosphatidyltransferase [Alphaproteobacteria bacterium]MCY4497720.1 CDP-diacylglycerol--serine O-phosphatidyltransferase [Rhodospirillaceae bacterium]